MNKLIRPFSSIGIEDVPLVGGKNASLGEMFNKLAHKGVPVPDGFATTAEAFRYFLSINQVTDPLSNLLKKLDRKTYDNLKDIGKQARTLILNAEIPDDLSKAIIENYKTLCKDNYFPVAVRSSATAEDLPTASFAGQHESYLNIEGEAALLDAVHRCFASLYTDRAIKYREDNGFEHDKVALSVGVQKMVRSDKGSAGIGFSLEPESGFRDIIHITGVWGLGENIVQGAVTPDEFYVFKPTLKAGKQAIIQKKLGEKAMTMIYSDNTDEPTINIDTPSVKQEQYTLSDAEVLKLAQWTLIIEQHYGKPMDLEWAKDGISNELFIVQARPETVRSRENPLKMAEYKLLERGNVLVRGDAIGSKIAVGTARILQSPKEAYKLNEGEIIITDITSPDWDPILKKAAAIITNKGFDRATLVTVHDSIGVWFSADSMGISKGVVDVFDSIVVATIPTIDPGEQIVLRVVGRSLLSGTHVRRVRAWPAQRDLVVMNNRDSIVLDVEVVNGIDDKGAEQSTITYGTNGSVRVDGHPAGSYMIYYADLGGRSFGTATRIDVSEGEPIIVFPPHGARVLMLEANGLRVGQWVLP